MTAREQTPQDRAPHKEPVGRKHAAKDEPGEHEQGVVKDERGQEQPADKQRATKNR